MDSLLVLTGVSGPADLLAAPPERRPTYVAADLSGLFRPADDGAVPLTGATRPAAGGSPATATVPCSTAPVDPVDALRLLCGVTWDGVPVAGITAARTRPPRC